MRTTSSLRLLSPGRRQTLIQQRHGSSWKALLAEDTIRYLLMQSVYLLWAHSKEYKSCDVEETFENEGDKSKERVHEKEGPSLR